MEKKNQSMEKRRHLYGKSFFLFGVLAIFFSCESDQQKVVNFTQLVMQDEFNVDGQPNANLWGYNIGRGQNGWGNNELQFYTDRTKNVLHVVPSTVSRSFPGHEKCLCAQECAR
jgi:hypothetical protein